MRHVRPALAALLATVGLLGSLSSLANGSGASDELARAANHFGLAFMSALGNGTANAVFSPWSVFSALNMLSLGLAEQSRSRAELDRLLGVEPGEPRNRRHELMRDRLRDLQAALGGARSPAALTFKQANLALFNKDLVQVRPDFRERLHQFYEGRIESFSLEARGASEPPVHERVNRWVANATQGYISRLADEGLGSDPNLALVLLNAAYFKGDWLHPFKSTSTGFFRAHGERPIQAHFMDHKPAHGEGPRFLHAHLGAHAAGSAPAASAEEERLGRLTRHLQCRALSLAYEPEQGQEFSMVFLLPDEHDEGHDERVDGAIDRLLAKLNPSNLDAVYRLLKPQRLAVSIPKFDSDAALKLPHYLRRMGLSAPFEPSKDFAAMFESKKDFAVDQMVHKSRIQVDEKGTEAAGATMVNVFMKLSAFSAGIPPFRANRPFLYIIRHNPSGVPLFMGRVDSVKEKKMDFDQL